VSESAPLLLVGVWTSLWCVWHSLLATHRWREWVRRLFPRWHVFSRALYVAGSTLTLAVLMVWILSLPERMLWDWTGVWAYARWLGLAEAAFLFWTGLRAHDNRHFLGLSQLRDHALGRETAEPPFRADGILAVIRHPWYSGTLLLLVFCLPWTDVNLVWRGVFFAYTLIGCELEERKLVRDLGAPYADYRRRVGRYWPRRRSR